MKSEKLRPDQCHLPLEDVEIAQGVLDAAQEKAAAVQGPIVRRIGLRPSLPSGLLAISFAEDGADHRAYEHALPVRLQRHDEDRRGRQQTPRRDPGAMADFGYAPPEIRLPSLSGAVVQAHSPEHVVPGGLPTEAAIAHVIVSSSATIRRFTVRPGSVRDDGSGSIGRRWQLVRLRLLPSRARRGSYAPPSGHGGSPVHGRDHGAGARSRGWPDENGLLDIRYALNHWPGLTRFLDDGRLELDSNRSKTRSGRFV